MSDDGLVVVEYTIDGEGKPDGTKWETEVEEYDLAESNWARIAEEIAAEHYEVQGPIGDPIEIGIYFKGEWRATVRLSMVQPIVTYQATWVMDDDDDEED